MQLKIKSVRLAFPNLFKASAPKGGGDPAFSASFILAPTDPQIAAIEAAIKAVAEAKWGAKATAILAAMKAKDSSCLHDGDAKAEYEGFAGNKYVSSRSKVKPGVFDVNRAELMEQDGKPYSGCYVNAVLELWAQDNDYGKRVNAQLRGVQFVRDGDRFAGGVGAAGADDFDDEIGDTGSDDSLLS